MHRNETPYLMWIKFRRVVGIPDVITYANFDDDWITDLGVMGGGQILQFPIGFFHHPYNTLALPCECVIQ